jgi:hypothetical protein
MVDHFEVLRYQIELQNRSILKNGQSLLELLLAHLSTYFEMSQTYCLYVTLDGISVHSLLFIDIYFQKFFKMFLNSY